MERLRLPINVTKTRSIRVPEEPLEFLGYRIGRNYRRDTGRAYMGTRPSRSSVVSVCRRISELTRRRYGLLDQETVVKRLNRLMTGWANYFQLGQVSPAYRAVDAHATRRLRQWLCRKHKVRAGKYVRFPDKRLWDDLSLLASCRGRHAFRGRTHDLVREPGAGNRHAGFDERGEETWLWWGLRHRLHAKAAGNSYSPHLRPGAPLLDSTLGATASSRSRLTADTLAFR